MTPEEFAAIEARANAASAGPWVDDVSQGGVPQVFEGSVWGPFVARIIDSQHDAEFIAHAREDIPTLLAAVRERDNTIARVRAVLDEMTEHASPFSSGRSYAVKLRAALDPQETP